MTPLTFTLELEVDADLVADGFTVIDGSLHAAIARGRPYARMSGFRVRVVAGPGYRGDCTACNFESEHGTEDVPHPVHESVHTCTPYPVLPAPLPRSP